MKNKKKTLVCLLVFVIIVLVILGIIFVFMGKEDKKIQAFYSSVEKAACDYAKKENYKETLCQSYESLCNISYSRLIESGNLDATLVDPKTNLKVSENKNAYVEVSWKDGQMVCTYKEG